MKNEIKLVASNFSPFCQRVEMLLVEKDLPYKRREVDLSNRPDWFKKDAPLGKVPLLYVDDKILFESMVICEYLDEAFGLGLHNKNLVIKSLHRGWVEVGNAILAAIFGIIAAKNQDDFNIKKSILTSKLAILEANLKYSPYFDGESFLLIDISMAPIFKILVSIENKFYLEIFDKIPKTASYAENLVTRHSLGKIIPKDYDKMFNELLVKRDSYLLKIKS
jgi:glutathione S-transferase